MPLPDWVLKHKPKGVYARKTSTGYALFRGHSQREPGKSYPVLHCDEYLGTVTEADGFKPSRPSVKPGITVLRFGIPRLLEATCALLRQQPDRLGLDAPLLFIHAVLSLEGRGVPQGFAGSYLSLMFPDVAIHTPLSTQQEQYLRTLKRQMTTRVKDRFGDDTDEVLQLCSEVYAVHVNGGWHRSDVPPRLGELTAHYGVSLELGEEEA